MRNWSAWALATALALTMAIAGIASAENPTVVQLGNLIVTLNGGFTPKQLPRDERAGIHFDLSGKIETKDKSLAPALREFVLEADRNAAIEAKGLPVCPEARLRAQDTRHAEAACPTAIVGRGTTDVEVEFPEQAPFIAHSTLLVFNGGVAGNKTKIFIHAYLSAPVSAAIVVPVEVTKIHNGRYGLKSVARIPKIAGGYGSATSFSLSVGRTFTYRGKRRNYLSLQCPDGRVYEKRTAVFIGGSLATGAAVRACTPRPSE